MALKTAVKISILTVMEFTSYQHVYSTCLVVSSILPVMYIEGGHLQDFLILSDQHVIRRVVLHMF